MRHGMVHRRFWLTAVGGAMLIALLPKTSGAQAQAIGPLTAAWTQVEIGEKVRVLRLDGSEIRGELSAIEPAALGVDVDDRVVRLDAAEVREIAVKDGISNGILIGLGAGLAAGLAAGVLSTSPDDGDLRGLAISLAGAGGLGIGIGLGAAIDAAKAHYKVVYRAPATVRIAPFAAPGGYGAAVAVAW